MADLTLSASEQAHLLSNPLALALLMDYHDLQQDQADSMGADCCGNELRREELRQHGAKVIAADPDLWPDDVRKQFAEPTGYAARRLARARAAVPAHGVTTCPTPAGAWCMREDCRKCHPKAGPRKASGGVPEGIASVSGSAPGIPVVLRTHHANCAFASMPDVPANCSCPPRGVTTSHQQGTLRKATDE